MQSARNILLIKPSNFFFNPETAPSNAFQVTLDESAEAINEKAQKEFDEFARTLKAKGVNVFVFEDTPLPAKPDAIFPNNWVSFHADGTIILYPMQAPNRRHERRNDIIDSLKESFEIKYILDLSGYETQNRFLEGTGSIVFDHDNYIAYACLSSRTDKEIFTKVCDYLQYEAICFRSHDQNGKEIYHTNVMMCIGKNFSVICLDSITDEKEKELVIQRLTDTGHKIIDISFEQMNNFAGNMLTLRTCDDKTILALSQSSFDILTDQQKNQIGKYCEPVPLPIKTIETIGGGSARCMIAEIFLKPLLQSTS